MPNWPETPNMAEVKYSALEEGAPLMEENNGSDAVLYSTKPKNILAKLRPQIPWILSGVLFVLLGASWASQWGQECSRSSFERGFTTELSKTLQHQHYIDYMLKRELYVLM
jgi:hypothetical protein